MKTRSGHVKDHLRLAEAEARRMIDAIPQQIWSGRADGTIDYCNQHWRAYTGMELTDIQGVGWQRMLHPDDKARVLEAWHESVVHGTPYEQEERHRSADGSYRWFLSRGLPLRGAEGGIERWYGANTEIADSKRLKEERERNLVGRLDSVALINHHVRNALQVIKSAGYIQSAGRNVADPRLVSFVKDAATRIEWALQEILPSLITSYDGAGWEQGSPLGRERGLSTDSQQASKRAAEALCEETFRSIFRNAGVGMVVVSPEGRFLAANRTVCQYLGYSEEELLSKTVQSAKDWPAFSMKLNEALQGNGTFQRLEKRCRHKSGRIVYTQSSVSLIRTSEGNRYFVGDVIDITKHKELEETVSNMNRRLIQAQEQERARIARDLHDDVSQRLALFAIQLAQVAAVSSPELPALIRQMQREVEELATNVQHLSHALHSSRLDYLGISSAMRSWCKEFGEKRKMEIAFESHRVPKSLPPEISLCLYRVLQEALHNAAKHSGATHIAVQLGANSREICLTVSDLGSGFDAQAAMKGRGLGLASMRERLALVSGQLSIESQSKRGTTIQARVPLARSSLSAKSVG